MTDNSSSQQEISLASGLEAVVHYGRTTVKLHPGGSVDVYAAGDIDVYTSGTVRSHAANLPAISKDDFAELPSRLTESLSQKVLEVGDRLRDGTVVIAVDLKNNTALFAPQGIFGGKAKFDDQHDIPAKLNREKYLGREDWRNITDEEGRTLSQVWDKVAPDGLRGRAAPWFWLESPFSYYFYGRVRRGGVSGWDGDNRDSSLPVPVVRSGPVSL